MAAYLQPALGIAALVALAWAVSENRRGFPWRTVAVGVGLQVALALLLIRVPASQVVFAWINDGVLALLRALEAGTSLVFGFLGGGPLPFEEPYPGAAYVFAFRSLPLVLVMAALSALLYHWRVLPLVVRGFAWVLQRGLGLQGPPSFATAANVFVGNVEAPLLVRPYLAGMSRSSLFIIMTASMATIAGTVFALYASLLADAVPGAAGHLLSASIISAPAAVVVARLMVPPDREEPEVRVDAAGLYENSMDAVTRGTVDGLRLLAYIVGMVLVLVALVALLNIILGALFADLFGEPLTLQRILGWALAPFAWLIGVPWAEAVQAGQLLGTKIVLNELIGYFDLAALPEGALSDRGRLVLTYAMCGFANFGGLGVMLGGLNAIVPERRVEVLGLGMRALLAGNIATFMTGAVAALAA